MVLPDGKPLPWVKVRACAYRLVIRFAVTKVVETSIEEHPQRQLLVPGDVLNLRKPRNYSGPGRSFHWIHGIACVRCLVWSATGRTLYHCSTCVAEVCCAENKDPSRVEWTR